MSSARGRTPASELAHMHRAWLALVDADGPFLALPALKRVYPNGIPASGPRARGALRDAKPVFDKAWDAYQQACEAAGRSAAADAAAVDALPAYREARDTWVGTVLRDVLGWGEHSVPTTETLSAAYAATSPDGRDRVTPTGALAVEGRVGALVLVVDPVDDLREILPGSWAASPIDRMESMLRAPDSACTIGVVTDGRWWALVSAAPGTMLASGIVDALTWIEEPATRDALIELLSIRRLLGGEEKDRLPSLFAESVVAAEEITEALGVQVRRAVELLVAAFSEAGRATVQREGTDPLPEDAGKIYDAAVTVMMRVVFLLFAEERDLLPGTALFHRGYGMAGVLDALEERERTEGEESLENTARAWHRLLATSRALAEGANFEDTRLPAYGGSLFDASRFPFLTATTARGTLAISIPDRVMLHVLRAVQVARTAGHEARRISFRDIDVEQIGYVYEGLLGYTCRRADETILGLIGKEGNEPEVPLRVLDDLAEKHADDASLATAILTWVKADQPSLEKNLVSSSRLAKALAAGNVPEDAERALIQVSRGDQALRTNLKPWIGAIRRDLRRRPTVFQPGDLIVVETPSRKNAGAHYTPRSLAEEVVIHALEPLVYRPGPYQTPERSRWRRLPAGELLQLKVADIACGSGAFLVAAARYLAERLVEAWQEEGLAEESPAALERRALREVVASCLYGADINPMAIEMCKLSLWLVSLDPGLPFSFVDHKVRVGNSLLGITDLRQIERLHIAPSQADGQGLFDLDDGAHAVDGLALADLMKNTADELRLLSEPVSENDPQRSTRAKVKGLARVDDRTALARRVADGVIAAGLELGGGPGRRLNAAYEDLMVAVERYLRVEKPDGTMLDAMIERGLSPTVATDYRRWRCLHWPLVFPDVMNRGGFDAIVGNPPFLGGKKISGAAGGNVRDWYVNVLGGGAKGSADLVAYFFLRILTLLRPTGALGLVATNTVAQGGTREVGLDRMTERGFTITRAIQSEPWPADSANLEYAAVWGTKGEVSAQSEIVCDGEPVRRISTLLEPAGRVEGNPERLTENANVAFIGCYVLGKGFILDPDEAAAWIEKDPRNAEVLFPYLNGEDLNSRPDCSTSRWIVDFNARTQTQAMNFRDPYVRLLQRVRPERAASDKMENPEKWWQFKRRRPAMRKAIAGLDEVLVIALVSKTVMPVRVPTGQVFSHMLGVFATDSYGDQAVLSSSLHQVWAINYGSTLETRVRYTPSDVFETFPQPEPSEALDAVGRILDTERREIMLRRGLGLTKLYNLVNDPGLTGDADPDIDRMRDIHRELDRIVASAYGWDDIPLDHGFHTYRRTTRWTISPADRIELLDRLLEENHRRAAAESASHPTGRNRA